MATVHPMICVLAILLIYFRCRPITATDIKRVDPGTTVSVLWGMNATRLEIRLNVQTGKKNQTFECSPYFIVYRCPDSNNLRLSIRTDPPFYTRPERFRAAGFELMGVSPSDAGRYHLTNNDIAKPVVIYVYQRPSRPILTFIRSPIVGQPSVLRCQTTLQSLPAAYRDESAVSYRWNITGGRPSWHVDGKDLVTNRVEKDDAGATIWCEVKEGNSSLVSQPSSAITLDTRYVENIRFTDGLDINRILAGERFEKICEADCSPECLFTWTDSKRKIVVEGKNLTFTNVSKALKENKYTCVASNTAGSLRKQFRIVQLSEPEIINFFAQSLINVDDTSVICNARSMPPPHVTIFDSANNNISSGFNQSRYTRYLPGCSLSGFYVCRAENELGVATRNVTINFTCEPRVVNSTKGNFLKVAKIGSWVRFQAQIAANPFPSADDVKLDHLGNDGLITNPTKVFIEIQKPYISLLLKDIADHSYGTYVLTMRNDLGYSGVPFELRGTNLNPGDNAAIVMAVLFILSSAGFVIMGVLWYRNRQKVAGPLRNPTVTAESPTDPVYQNSTIRRTAPGQREADNAETTLYQGLEGPRNDQPQVYDNIRHESGQATETMELMYEDVERRC